MYKGNGAGHLLSGKNNPRMNIPFLMVILTLLKSINEDEFGLDGAMMVASIHY